MYDLKLPNQLSDILGPHSISMEEIEDVFLELSDNECIISFNDINGLRRTLPRIAGIEQNLDYFYYNERLNIAIFSKSLIKEVVIQKIIYRLFKMNVIVLSHHLDINNNIFGKLSEARNSEQYGNVILSMLCKIR